MQWYQSLKGRKLWPVEEELRPAFRVWLLGARLFGTPKTAKRGSEMLLLLPNHKSNTQRSGAQSQKLRVNLEMQLMLMHNNCRGKKKNWKLWQQTTLLLNWQRWKKSCLRQDKIMWQWEKVKLLIVCHHKASFVCPLQLGNAESLAFRNGPHQV